MEIQNMIQCVTVVGGLAGLGVHNEPLFLASVCLYVYVRATKDSPVPCTNTALVLPLPGQLGLTDQHTQEHKQEPCSHMARVMFLLYWICSFRRLAHTFRDFHTHKHSLTKLGGSRSMH